MNIGWQSIIIAKSHINEGKKCRYKVIPIQANSNGGIHYVLRPPGTLRGLDLVSGFARFRILRKSAVLARMREWM